MTSTPPQQPWQPSNPPVPQQPQPSWFSSHKMLAIIIGAVVLLLLCCGGLGIAVSGGEDSASESTSTSATQESKTSEQEDPEDEPAEEGTSAEEPKEKATSEKATSEEPAEEETTKEEPAEEPSESLSPEQQNAIDSAQNYLDFMAFSKQGLIDQLSSPAGDDYPEDVAVFAVEHIEDDVDWNEQAVKSAENYLDLMPFSRNELIDQLSSDAGDGFTREQAEYAADQVGL